jgi:hypothetical protein
MPATSSDLYSRRDASPCWIITIEGIGDARGLYKFCWPKVPRYAASNSLYKPWLTGEPGFVSQQAKELGGISSAGQITFELLDVDDALTAKLALGPRPDGFLNAAITDSQTTVDISNAASIVYGLDVLFIGDECMVPTSSAGGTVVNVTRSALGTLAQAQSQVASPRVPVYMNAGASCIGRRVIAYLGFDAEDSDASSELEVEQFRLDLPQISSDFNSYQFTGISQHRYLDRLLGRAQFDGYVAGFSEDESIINFEGGSQEINPHFVDRMFFKVNDEVLSTELSGTWLGNLRVVNRGVAGTTIGEVRQSDRVTQALVADPDGGFGSFRYQEVGAETTSRSTGTWISDDHPALIMLAFMLSSSSLSDNLANYSRGNYAALPAGWGLGIPIGEVNDVSFLRVWFRTLSYSLPFFTLSEPESAREVFDRICQLCGYDITTVDGEITIDAFRMPLEGEQVVTWNEGTFVVEFDAEGNAQPTIEVEYDTEIAAGAVVFESLTSRGTTVKTTFTSANFQELFGNVVGYFATEDRRIELDARYIRSDVNGAEPELMVNRSLQLLYRYRRPLMKIRCRTDLSQLGVRPGQTVLINHSQVPDLANKRRGISVVCKVLSRTIEVGGKVNIAWELAAYGVSGRFGRVCPSGMIDSVAGNDATVVANRYSDPSQYHGLPTSDAFSFRVGDRVRLRTRGGLPVVTAPTYQTVTGIAGNVVTLDGNFGASGSFANGTVLEWVDRDDSIAAMHDTFVYIAASTPPLVIGASTQTPWQYGEP